MSTADLIVVARGERPGDLLLINGRVVNTFTAEVEETDVVIFDGKIAGLGKGYQAQEVVDLQGRYLLPGFIDGHVHIESSYLWVTEYARAVVPRGTAAVITDLHEVANVAGLFGLQQTLEAASTVPLDVFLMVPSCVPATSLETAGATLEPRDIAEALNMRGAIGLGEVMNFPGVIGGDDQVLNKIAAVGQRPVDGHAPGVRDRALNAYLAAGPRSDHETTQLEEGREKLQRGMYLMIREGTSEKNLEELLPLVTDATYPRCLLVVDDRSCTDLRDDGDLDAVVRKAIRLGLDPIRAVQMVTINPANYFGLRGHGAIAPGCIAHLIVVNDLREMHPRDVYHSGRLVARDGQPLFSAPRQIHERLTQTVNVHPFAQEALALPARGPRHPVIEIVPRQITTRHSIEEVRGENGYIVPDVDRDILKLAVVERHKATGNIGLGLVRGFGLKRGALAGSFAHDSHNIVVVGTNDADMYAAIKEIERIQGGLAVVEDGRTVASLALPVLGLMSPQPLEIVADAFQRVEAAAVSLGAKVHAPFAVLSFLALPVIPTLRVTDLGLVDASKGEFFDFAQVSA